MSPELLIPNTPQNKPTSKMAVLIVFGTAFIVLLILLNLPTLIKAIAYPFSHSETADNELLTQQYRDIYGYDRHPELINVNPVETVAPLALPNGTVVTPAPAPGGPAQAGFQAEISIPKIGVTAPVLQVNNATSSVILAALKNGVVLYPGSVNPGQTGMAVIVGHSSSDFPWTKYSAIFSLLGKLQPNDLIYVTVNGTKYTYQIRAVEKGSAQQLIDSGLYGDLIVSTCWPIGTDANRIAVSASLIH